MHRDVALIVADEPLGIAIGERYRGYDVVVPRTPLDVIRTLVTASERIGAAILSPGTRWATGIREFLADEYPEIDRIVVAA